jgi:hypothetical protein
MTKAKSKASTAKFSRSGAPAVDAFIATIDHPLKSEIEAVRGIIRRADAGISENVKWNAPNFLFKDDFATLKLRPQTAVQVVFHTGAKPKGKKIAIDDPKGLLKWVTDDRAVATFSDMTKIKSRQVALTAIVRQWIEQM